MRKNNLWKTAMAGILSLSLLSGMGVSVLAEEVAPAEEAQASSFQVGASIRDITPSEDMLPLTRAPKVEMVGVLDPISVRVLAFQDADTTALIITCETGRSFGPQFAQAVVDHTGIPLENIIMTSTHTHAAPEVTEYVELDFDENDPEVTNQQKWAKFAMDQMLDAVDEALANLQPASVGIGYSESYINVNRNYVYNEVAEDGTVSETRNLGWSPNGPSDRTLAAIRFNAEDGSPIAFLVNFSVHGTVMHANTCIDGKTGISSDIPGFVSSYLEQNNEGAVAMWLSGAAGDQNPIIQNDLYSRDPVTGEFSEIFNDDYAILTWISQIHYADVERALNSIDTYVENPELIVGYGDTTIPAKDEGDFYVSLQNLRIGDIDLACFSGELFTSTGEYLKDNALLKDTLVVNHAWQRDEQNNGYCADDWTIENGGFGQRQAKYKPGYLNDALAGLLSDFEVASGAWLDNGDGTATYSTTGEVTIVGLDGVGGTADDNQIVNPAGTVLLEDVVAAYDEEGKVYVDLGGGFKLTAGSDGKIGTKDDTVSFGTYQISEHIDDGKKDAIDWLLLDIQDGKATLITEKVIDGVQFNLSDEDGNDWAESNLRSWLNSQGGQELLGDTTGFYDAAFTDEDKEKILLTDVDMHSDSSYWAYNRMVQENWWGEYTTTGTDTQDYVYALSGEEVFKYFGLSTVATLEELGHDPMYYTGGMCNGTGYALYVGVNANGGGNGKTYIGYVDSWTRSQGAEDPEGKTSCGVFLGSVGSLNVGRSVTRGYGARPVINVTLE